MTATQAHLQAIFGCVNTQILTGSQQDTNTDLLLNNTRIHTKSTISKEFKQ